MPKESGLGSPLLKPDSLFTSEGNPQFHRQILATKLKQRVLVFCVLLLGDVLIEEQKGEKENKSPVANPQARLSKYFPFSN